MNQPAGRQVLVVDDEAGMRTALEASFSRRGWQVETAVGAADAMTCFRRRPSDLVVTDMRMSDGDGFSVIRQVQEFAPHTAVILLTAFGSVPDAVEAMQSGACDYLVKPVAFEQLEKVAEKILRRAQLAHPRHRETRDLRLPSLRSSATPGGNPFIGHSSSLAAALDRARKAAASDADILLEAESGTGKELLARLIHGLSPRRGRAFVALNCAAFPETLLESELFGHTRGAFTGAVAATPGKFEQADGGTLLLDEIGEMPLALQPKLLRVLQEREFEPLGATRSVKVDIRVIATTNRKLEAMVLAGSFRADLYYRLNVIALSLPALRQRVDDIPELAQHFARLYAPAGHALPRLSTGLLERLVTHDWPGNVRELANLIRRAVALSLDDNADPEIGVEALEGCALADSTAQPNDRLQAGLSLGDMERRLFEVTLAATGGNRSRAAEMLGVSLRTVRNKIRDYGLPPRIRGKRGFCP